MFDEDIHKMDSLKEFLKIEEEIISWEKFSTIPFADSQINPEWLSQLKFHRALNDKYLRVFHYYYP